MASQLDALAMPKPYSASLAANWFRVFYKGLDNPLYFPFTESEAFENPTTFRLDSFADDDSTRHLYSLRIRPGFLPVGISTSNRIIKPGYETYQPVVAAWQFGLGQVPPCRRDKIDIIDGLY